MYVLKDNNGKGYVSKSGHKSSFCHDLRYARKYPTFEAAQADACTESEHVVDLERLLDDYRK